MIYPIGARRNDRYRGPIESIKLNCNINELSVNIQVLKDTFEKEENELTKIKNNIEPISIKKCRFVINKMNDSLNIIKGGF